jgi:hypothetical protein
MSVWSKIPQNKWSKTLSFVVETQGTFDKEVKEAFLLLVEVLLVSAFCFWSEYLVFFLHNLPTTINFDHNLNTIQVFL